MKMDAEQLIECVRDFPLLYNLEEKEYCDTDKKERAWKEIGVLMNKSGTIGLNYAGITNIIPDEALQRGAKGWLMMKMISRDLNINVGLKFTLL
nr:uncharacterized protein LOC106677595 isoform X2 [Halyomorpha halys]